MLKKILFTVTLLTLAACDPGIDSGATSKDGYYMEPAARIANRPIVFNLVPSDRAVELAFEKTKGRQLKSGERLFGFTVISKEACTITIVDPAVAYRPEQLGHEVAHCLYGDWHPKQDEQRV